MLSLLLLGLLRPLVADITSIPECSKGQDGQTDYAQHRTANKNPAESLDLRLHVTVEHDTDFVENLLDLSMLADWRVRMVRG